MWLSKWKQEARMFSIGHVTIHVSNMNRAVRF